jgi:hypothetical protein
MIRLGAAARVTPSLPNALVTLEFRRKQLLSRLSGVSFYFFLPHSPSH